jgi:hypothetical protein
MVSGRFFQSASTTTIQLSLVQSGHHYHPGDSTTLIVKRLESEIILKVFGSTWHKTLYKQRI